MAAYLSNELAGGTTGTATSASTGYKPVATVYNGKMRRFRASVTLASQTTSDTITLANVPAGYTFAYGTMNTDTSLGSTTVAIGTSASSAKYKAAATYTSTDTVTFFGKNAVVGASTALSAEETIIATLAAANMPSSGLLVVDLYFSAP